MVIKTSTYPMGPAKHLDKEDTVQIVNGRGWLDFTQVGQLVKGDEYYVSNPVDKPRTPHELLEFLEESGVEYSIDRDVDWVPQSVDFYNQHGNLLISFPYGANCLKEGINYLMDEAEGKVHG